MKTITENKERKMVRVRSLTLALVLFLSAMAGIIFFSTDSFGAGEPTIDILHPTEGQMVYGNQLHLKLDVENIELNGSAIGGTNVPGEGHYHLYINDALIGPYASLDLNLSDLPEGDHNLRVEIRENDHSELDPPVEDQVNFTIVYPSIEITKPMEDVISYGGMLEYMVNVDNFTLNQSAIGGEKVDGEGHYHLYINDGLVGPFTELHNTLTDLPAGDHTLKVELRNNDHTGIMPEPSDMVNFTISEDHPMIMIKSPMNESINYGGMLEFEVEIMNFTMNESAVGGENMVGEGHYHVYINDGLVGPYTESMVKLEDLPAGDHVLKVMLMNNDHTPIVPHVMDTIHFTISEMEPSIEIIEPANGSILYQDHIDIEVMIQNFMMNASAIGGENMVDEGHYHIYINDGLIGPYTDSMVTLEDLPAGDHVLKVMLMNNDHTPIIPHAMDMIHFTVVDVEPMISIEMPMNGSYLYQDFLNLEVMVENLTMNGSAYGGDNVPGEGHYHVYINDELVGPFSEEMITLEDLPAGMHHLMVELRNNDHSPLISDSDMISDSIWFTISDIRPSIDIMKPMYGQIIYDDTLHLDVMVENFTMNASAIGGENSIGEGHYHIYVNGDLVGPYTDMMVNLTDLPPGTHELKVELRNNDHSMIHGNETHIMDMIRFHIVDQTPSIEIVDPTDGSWFYGGDLEVKVDIDDLTMNASAIGGNNTPGEGHWHLYINGDLVGPYTDEMVTLTGLPAGDHVLKVMLVNNDHTPIMPEASAMVNFQLLPVPAIEIISPDNDTMIQGTSLDLEVEISDFAMNSSAVGGSNMPGEGHYHIYINEDLVGPYTDEMVTITDLPAGDHVLKVELRNNDHSALGIEAMDMIYFTIEGPETEVTFEFGPVMKGEDSVSDAKVEIMIGGETYTANTNEQGIATFTIPSSMKGETFDYKISKDGYENLEGTGTLEGDGTISGMGSLEVEEEEEDSSIYLILVIAAVIIIAVLLVIVLGSRKSKEQFEE